MKKNIVLLIVAGGCAIMLARLLSFDNSPQNALQGNSSGHEQAKSNLEKASLSYQFHKGKKSSTAQPSFAETSSFQDQKELSSGEDDSSNKSGDKKESADSTSKKVSKKFYDGAGSNEYRREQLPDSLEEFPKEASSKSLQESLQESSEKENKTPTIGGGFSASNAGPPKVKGKVPPLEGLISKTSFPENLYKAYAAYCDNPAIQIFDLKTMTVLADNPITEKGLVTSTAFDFDVSTLKMDIDFPTRYVLRVVGCEQKYERIVTSYFKDQNITGGSTLLTKILKTSANIDYSKINGEKLDQLVREIDEESEFASKPAESYAAFASDPKVQEVFNQTFQTSYPVLKQAAPDIDSISMPASIKEGASERFYVTTSHWDPAYETGYEWRIDGELAGLDSYLSQKFLKNEASSALVTLYVGTKLASGKVDRDRPYHQLDYTIPVENLYPAVPPVLALNAGSNDPSSTRNITLEIATGAEFINCETFSSLAIVENTNPSKDQFTIQCKDENIQLANYAITSSGDGLKSLYLFAMDKAGRISKTYQQLDLVLDTSPPDLAFVNMQPSYRADRNTTFKWSMTEATSDSLTTKFTFSFSSDNGVTWTSSQVTAGDGPFTNQEFSTIFPIDNITTSGNSTAKIKVDFTDLSGNTSSITSPGFEITRPELAITPAINDFGNVLSQSTGVAQSFSVENSGTAPAELCSSAVLSGTNASEFTITSDGCSTNNLAINGSTCPIQVAPTPATKGSKSATLSWTCGSDSVSSSLSYTSTNNPPVAGADFSRTMAEDGSISITGNAGTDIDGDSMTYQIVTPPANGALSPVGCALNCTYTPNADYFGSDSFTYKVNDGTADSVGVTTANITVDAVNDAPTLAANQAVSTNEDAALTFNLAAGADIDSATLYYVKLTDTTNGTITCVGGTSQSCTYTPNADFNGTDSFTYNVNDAELDSTTATVTITVNSLNDAPTLANAQAVSTNEDTALTFNLTAGADVDGDTLNYVKLTNTTNGTIACTGGTSQSCTYTPNADFNGTDSFTYNVNDGALDSTTATVTITVNPINDAPTLAATQSVATNEDTAVNFTLNAGNDVDGDTLTYIVTSNPAAGTLTCDGGTSTNCSYTPAADDNGSYTFTYKVNDGFLDSTEATVTISIGAENDPPVMIGDQSFSTDEDTLLSLTLSGANDIDLPAQTISYKIITPPTNGTLASCINTSTYGTDIVCDYTPNADFNGTDSFTYRANDGIVDSNTVSTVTITVNPVNDAPTLASAQTVSTNEDTALTFNLTAGSDIEGDTLTYIKVTDTTNGTITCAGGTSQSCTYTPNLNFNGTDSFTYKVNDGSLDSTTATVTITVNSINDAPTLASAQAVSTNEDTALTFNLTAGADVDGDTLNYVKLTNTTNGTITCTGGTSQSCTYTPNADFNGTDSFTYNVNDSSLDSTTATVTITVNPVNDAPTLASAQAVSTNEDTAVTFNLTAGADVDGDTLNYVKLTDTTNGTITCTGGTSQSCTYTPNTNFNGTDSFTYNVNDSALDSTTATVTITVNSVNDAPTLASAQAVSTNEDTALTFNLTAGADVDGDTLNYVKLTNTTNGTITCTGGTSQSCTYTPNADFNGTDSFTYNVNDSSLNSTTATVTITVNPINDAPTLASAQAVSTNEDTALTFNLTAGADVDGDTLNYVKLTNTTNGTITCVGGTGQSCTYSPNANFNGTDSFTYNVNDSLLDSTTATVTITVNSINDPPVVAANQSFNVNDNTLLSFTISAASDVDGDALTYKVITAPTNGTLSNCINTTGYLADLTCDYTANANFHGSDSFTYVANDSTVDSVAYATITFNVTDVTAPSAPAVILASAQYTNVTSNTFTATSCVDTPGILINEGTQPLAGDAAWQTCSTTAGALSYTLASATEGAHAIKVWAKDPQGNVSTASTDITVYYDITNPALSLTNPGALKGGSIATLNWTLTETYSSSSQNMSVDYYDGASWISIGTTAAANGPLSSAAFSKSWTVPSLNITTAQFRVSYTDLAGNASTQASTAFEIDSTAPLLTNSSPSENAYVLNSETFTGTCEVGSTINFSGDLMAAFDISCAADGTYSQLVNFTSGDGLKTITLTGSDTVGNTTVIARTVTVDTVAPNLTRTSGDNPTYTNQSTVTWGGACEGTYPISVTGDTTDTFNCNNGTWSWTTPAETIEGTYSYSLVQTDGAGNTSTSLSLSWNLDTTAPNFSIAETSPLTNNNDSVSLSGACDGTLTIYITGAATDTFSCVNGTWSWTSPTFSTDATYTFNFSHKDEVGNETTASFVWTRDTSGPALSVDTKLNVISNVDSATWSGTCDSTYSVDISGAETASVVCSSGAWTWTTTLQTTDATRNYTIGQTNGLGTTTSHNVSWLRETDPPSISSISTTASDPTDVNFIPISLNAASANTSVNVTEFCLKSNDSAAPVAGAPCWTKVNDPSVALSPSASLSLSGFSFLLGWEPLISYNVYAWVQDAAGNISVNTATGASVTGTDMFTIIYDPAVPPEIWDVIAANSDTTAIPPSRAESSVPAGSDVYIRWKVTDPDDPLPTGSISMFYTQDEINFTPITAAQSLDPNSNNCPSITLATNEGCFKWTGGSPLNVSYKIRVRVTDLDGLKTQTISNPLNSNNIRIIAGNTESGLGGSGASALFFTRDYSTEPDLGTLVVTDDGNIYVADYKRGILTIDPADGKQKVFIAQTGTSSGDGGAAVNATLNYATKIALDYNNRLLILDTDRIRRVDLNQSPPTIDTIIGGGIDTLDTVVNPLDLKIAAHSKHSWVARSTVFFAMPNGDIVFESDSSGHKAWNDADMRIRIYNNATKQIESKFVSGTGTGWDATQDILSCRLDGLGIEFDMSTSKFSWASVFVLEHDSYTNCLANHTTRDYQYTRSWLDNTLTAATQFNETAGWHNHFHRQGMNGKLYTVVYDRYVHAMTGDGSFTRILGTGTPGTCPDGTLATSCNMNLADVFITSSGKIYFIDGGTIRTVDDNGNIITIAGQKKSYGDGVNALNARFADVSSVNTTNDGRIITGDSYYLKEFTIEGNINIIAGTGNHGYQAVGVDAKTTTLYDQHWIVVDPVSGDVFARGHPYYLSRLDRVAGTWEQIVGGGASYYWDADGMAGSAVSSSSWIHSYGLPLNYHNGKLLASRMKYNDTDKHWEDFMFKLYDTKDTVTPYKQSHLAGTNDTLKTYDGGYMGICASGSIAADCKIPYYSYPGMMTYDTTNNRYLFPQHYWHGTYSRYLYSVTEGGTIDLVTTLPRYIRATYVFATINTVDYLFYCGGDNRLYRHNLTTDTDEGMLPWNTPTLGCSGHKMDYDASINAIIFPFTQNGLSGVAAYYDPEL